MSRSRSYLRSLRGYWPIARALSKDLVGAVALFCSLLSIPVRKRLSRRGGRKIRISLSNRELDFFVRDGADISALGEVFVGGQYRVSEDLTHVEKILDIGAHIGSTALFFADRFPQASIVAYEPDAENFSLLLQNTASIPAIRCVNAAVAEKTGTVCFYPNIGSSTKSSLKSLPGALAGVTVDSVSLNDILKEGYNIVKFDIEGAEYDVFAAADPALIGRVTLYIGELHHDLMGRTPTEFCELFAGFESANEELRPTRSVVHLTGLVSDMYKA